VIRQMGARLTLKVTFTRGFAVGLCRRGQVLLATVNEATMVPFVSQQLNNLDLALAMARRGNLPGAEGLVAQQFERQFSVGQYKEAAEVAAESPQGILRTKEVRGRQKGPLVRAVASGGRSGRRADAAVGRLTLQFGGPVARVCIRLFVKAFLCCYAARTSVQSAVIY
jgi:hypothetical protein